MWGAVTSHWSEWLSLRGLQTIDAVGVCVGGWLLLHYWWEYGQQPLWGTVWRFLKKLDTGLPHDLAVLLLGVYPEKAMIWWGDMHSTVHCSTVCNGWNLGTAWVSISRGLGGEDVEHVCDSVLLSHEREWDDAIGKITGGPGDCHPGWGRLEGVRQVSREVTNMQNLIKGGRRELAKQRQT